MARKPKQIYIDPKDYYPLGIIGWASKNDETEFGGVPEDSVINATVPPINRDLVVQESMTKVLTKNFVTNSNIGRILCYVKAGRSFYLINSEGFFFYKSKITCFDIKCHRCDKATKLGWEALLYHIRQNEKLYECKSCSSLGDKNPFYGKHHTEENKDKLRVTPSQPGKKNPFYGMTHSKETREKLSRIGKERAKDPAFRERMRLNGIKSLENRKYRMTKPERKTKAWLENHDIPNHYNLVLNKKYQYDFRIKNSNILIEVHGDYWHANPKLYTKDMLTERQIFKIARDKKKLAYAREQGYEILYIWEHDIKNNDFSALSSLLEQGNDEI